MDNCSHPVATAMRNNHLLCNYTMLYFVPDSRTAFRISEKGHNSYGHLRVVNSTHLYVDQVFSSNGTVIDSIWITQTRHGPFMPHVVCNSTSTNHISCFCPPIFPYITIGCVLSFIFIVFIAVCVVLCKKYVIPKCHASPAHTTIYRDIKLLTSLDSDSDDILLSWSNNYMLSWLTLTLLGTFATPCMCVQRVLSCALWQRYISTRQSNFHL